MVSKKVGNELERQIICTNDYYANKKIADIKKAHENIVIQKRIGGNIKGFLKGKSDLDFYGYTKDYGFIKFDTKAVKGDRLPLKNIKPHQIDIIREACYTYKYMAFLLVWNWKDDIYYILPANFVVDAYNRYEVMNKAGKNTRGCASIKLSEFMGFKKEGLIIDYLKWIREIIRM